jgi:DNA-binding NarL/FixJ family response regulator
VLVVDDDADVRELLRVALTAADYQVGTVANGREAMHYLRSHADACIICSISSCRSWTAHISAQRSSAIDRLPGFRSCSCQERSMRNAARASSGRAVWCRSRSTSTT